MDPCPEDQPLRFTNRAHMNAQQRSLFPTDLPAWEIDAARDAYVATVVFSEAPYGPFDYAIPAGLRSAVSVGRRVRVPLGRGGRTMTGYCVRLEHRHDVGRPLKDVLSLMDDRPLLTSNLLGLTAWMADYYLCPWGVVLDAVVPAAVRGHAGTRLVKYLRISPRASAELAHLELPDKQREALKVLAASPEPMTPQQLARAARCSLAPIQRLRKLGLVHEISRRVRRADVADGPHPRQSAHELNADQQRALDRMLAALHARQHRTLLIHGVTGSGKTEVYIRAIEEVIGFGRQAIVLVPEISLTPQTCERFRARFDRVAVLHSHLTDAERHWHWERIAAGEVQVVIGARSAVFAPAPHLGMIILDEEHEASFKQDIAPRYHAREVALWRAREENVPLVLGSATPSLDSWQRAQSGEFELLEMPRRVLDRPLPAVTVVDLRMTTKEYYRGGAISRRLHQAMSQALQDGGQIILLLNRRGYSTTIQCPACGHVVKCDACDIALTHHRDANRAMCHYCDHTIPAPAVCPQCSSTGILYAGLGTQKLEQEVRARFPRAPCLRMDSDSMQRPGSHEQALARFRSGEIKILLGTQMIAKGLDFPGVTLVGVINADTTLHFPDFRAAERTFQLVTQVAGRTGRGEHGGWVLVQTFSPDHFAIQAAARHDFAAFAQLELPVRAAFSYPPMAAMIRLVVRGPSDKPTEAFAAHVVDLLRRAWPKVVGPDAPADLSAAAAAGEFRILGPAPAPIAKLRGMFRFHALVQGRDRELIRNIVRLATEALKPPEGIQWIVDVDPCDVL